MLSGPAVGQLIRRREDIPHRANLSWLLRVAIKPIKRRAYIATYRGRRITTEEADRRTARGRKLHV